MPDAHDLVSLMTAREPDLRPSAGEVCKHPFFWNEEKRLSFLLEFSDRLEQVCTVCVCCLCQRGNSATGGQSVNQQSYDTWLFCVSEASLV